MSPRKRGEPGPFCVAHDKNAKSPNLPLPLPLPLPGALPPQPAHSLAPSRAPCLCPQGVPRRVSRVCRVSRPRIGDRGRDSSARAQRPRLWVRIRFEERSPQVVASREPSRHLRPHLAACAASCPHRTRLAHKSPSESPSAWPTTRA